MKNLQQLEEQEERSILTAPLQRRLSCSLQERAWRAQLY